MKVNDVMQMPQLSTKEKNQWAQTKVLSKFFPKN